MDYTKYFLNKKELLSCVFEALTASGIASWLLYRSMYGLVTILFFLPICVRNERKKRLDDRKGRLLLEFKDAMQSVTAALQAGYSMENAWRESEKEMTELYGEEGVFVQELHQMNQALAVNQPIEKLLYEFAMRSGCEDIRNFSEVFLFAKRSGGDFQKIIQNTIHHISDKIEVEKEIQTVISAKKMEQKVMNVIPVFILFYLNLTSGDFLEPLYGNALGVCVMTGALMAYLGAIILAKRIMAIKV